MSEQANLRTVIYARVSKANRAGETTSVDQQIAEMRDEIARHPHLVETIEPCTDRAVSGSRAKAHRPGWERLQHLVETDEIDVVAVWESSRSTRQLAQWATFRDLCLDHGVRWLTRDGLIDLDSGSSRLSGGVGALVAESEAVSLSDRARRTTRSNAAGGRPHGRERYGYRRVYDPANGRLIGVEVHPDESAVVRRLVTDTLAGISLYEQARALNAEGLLAPGDAVNARRGLSTSGSLWHPRTIKYLLRSRDYCGVRVHRTRKRFDTATILATAEHAATWPAIITDDEHRALARLLDDPTRKTRGDLDGRRHLLSGVLRCGKCGAGMNRVSQPRGKAVQNYYMCGQSGCRGTSIRQADTDALITEVVLARLARPDAEIRPATDTAVDVESARRTVATSQARLDELASGFATGVLSLAAYAAAEKDLTARVEAAEAVLRVPAPVRLPESFRGPVDPAAAWEQADIETRHQVVVALIDRISVGPGRRGRLPYDPARVLPGIEWAGTITTAATGDVA